MLYAMACARLPFSDEDMKALSRNEYHGKIKFSKRVSKGMGIRLEKQLFVCYLFV